MNRLVRSWIRSAASIFVAWSFVGFGCSAPGQDDRVAAEAAGEELLWSEVFAQLPSGLTPQDSAALVESFVREWKLRKGWLEKAESQLGNDLDSFEIAVQKYREDLLVLHYKNRLAQQEMDTVVSEQELSTAYRTFRNQFSLPTDIVRVSYLAIPVAVRWPAALKISLKKADRDASAELTRFAQKWARQYRLSDTGWVELPELTRQMGLPAYQPDFFLTPGYKEWSTGSTRYAVQIHSVRRASSPMPLEMARPLIKAALLEERKRTFWKQLESDMLQE